MSELVIFDLDETIIKGQSQNALLKYAFSRGLIKLPVFLKLSLWFIFYKIGLVKNPKRAMEYAYGFLCKYTNKQVQEIMNDFVYNHLSVLIYQEALGILQEHKKNRHSIIVVSNTLSLILHEFVKIIGVELYLGTELEIIDGKFTGKIKDDIVYGANKIKVIKNFVALNNFSFIDSWAYTDHISDASLLEMVAYPFAINPDKDLLVLAKSKKWPVVFFNNLITKLN